MDFLISLIPPLVMLGFGLVLTFAFGAANDAQDLSPIRPVISILLIAAFMVLQAILFALIGIRFWGML